MKLRDPFAPMWAELERRLAAGGERAFAWEPDRWTLSQYAAAGMILWITKRWPDGAAIAPSDPRWSDPDAEEDGEEASIVAIWPELVPHVPQDGRLRAVATLSMEQGTDRVHDQHEVRLVDLDTLALGPVTRVVPFGARGVN